MLKVDQSILPLCNLFARIAQSISLVAKYFRFECCSLFLRAYLARVHPSSSIYTIASLFRCWGEIFLLSFVFLWKLRDVRSNHNELTRTSVYMYMQCVVSIITRSGNAKSFDRCCTEKMVMVCRCSANATPQVICGALSLLGGDVLARK